MCQTLDGPNYLRMREMAERVRAETGGRIRIEVHGASALGSDSAALAMLQRSELRGVSSYK